jgi:adenosine deaminase
MLPPADSAPRPDPATVARYAASLADLPKAELHQHLDGALRPETAVELAREIGMPLDLPEAVRRMVAPERCASQASLLTYFDLPIALLQTRGALRRAAAELVETLAADGVRYGEIRWAPRLHLGRGLSVPEVLEAVAEGIEAGTNSVRERPPLVALIVTAMRSDPPGANVQLARLAGGFGWPIVGFDLAGPEADWPAPPHAAAFAAAAEGGLGLTAHAGEVPGTERIRDALRLGVSRIAHGVTAADDPALVEELRAGDVTLDLCPTSNVQAGIVPSLEAHPIGALHRRGVSVTCSTDDRTVSGTTLTEELARTAVAQGLTAAEQRAIALNAFRRGFAPVHRLAALTAEAERAWRAWEETAPADLVS